MAVVFAELAITSLYLPLRETKKEGADRRRETLFFQRVVEGLKVVSYERARLLYISRNGCKKGLVDSLLECASDGPTYGHSSGSTTPVCSVINP